MELPEDVVMYKVVRLFYLTPDILLETGDVFYYSEAEKTAYTKANPFNIIEDPNLESVIENLKTSQWIKKINEEEVEEKIKCECGAEKANTTHSFWCPKHEENQS